MCLIISFVPFSSHLCTSTWHFLTAYGRVHFKFQGEWITTSITTFLKNKNIAAKTVLSLSLSVLQSGILLFRYLNLDLLFLCLQVPSYSIDCYFHLLSYTLSCKPYMSLSRWYSHRRWPGVHDIVCSCQVGFLGSSCSRLRPVDTQTQQTQIRGPFEKHTHCLSSL